MRCRRAPEAPLLSSIVFVGDTAVDFLLFKGSVLLLFLSILDGLLSSISFADDCLSPSSLLPLTDVLVRASAGYIFDLQ